MGRRPSVSVIVVNFNRQKLLQQTLSSLRATAPEDAEIFVIDNASTDGAAEWLRQQKGLQLILNSQNLGGQSINQALRQARGKFILISENDFEYLPGWFEKLAKPFAAIEALGLLSPLSPFPDELAGELWTVKPHRELTSGGVKVFEALSNIGTSSFFKRELIRSGVYFKSLKTEQFCFPDDGDFSNQVKARGRKVAWSEQACVINWGHRESEWQKNPDYYQKNWQSKGQLSIDGLEKLVGNSSLAAGIELHRQQSKLSQERLQKRLLGQISEEGRLFLDSGKGFSAADVIVGLWSATAGSALVQFSLEGRAGLKKLRWDPLEGELIEIDSLQVFFKNLNGEEKRLGADELSLKLSSTDPQVEFGVPGGLWNSVELHVKGVRIKVQG